MTAFNKLIQQILRVPNDLTLANCNIMKFISRTAILDFANTLYSCNKCSSVIEFRAKIIQFMDK